EFTVADTGKGMSEEDLPRLFDRHWRADPGAPGGAGLGMPIVHGIVVAHGGEINAQSAPGVGTTIRFTIPSAHLPCIAASSPGT
ncbi:MAG TPA: ATP-binding protein, partial [Usitatibacter sp.]|nr:ATP-binding protein [Usitatibacter sp.]